MCLGVRPAEAAPAADTNAAGYWGVCPSFVTNYTDCLLACQHTCPSENCENLEPFTPCPAGYEDCRQIPYYFQVR